jgi:hypothetical protein
MEEDRIMTLSSVLEVGLGLILVYYVLSLIVSYITAEIIKWTELQAKDLEEGLRELLEDSGKLEEFMEHPWIKKLKPKRLKFLSGDIRRGQVNYIPPSTFVLALFDVLASGEKGENRLADIRNAINALPKGETRDALLRLINSVNELEEARKLVEAWFNDTMANVSLLYKQHAQRIAIIVAAVVTIVIGADSIAIANSLWEEPSLRAAIAVKADMFIEREPEGDIQTFLSELKELQIPILWTALPGDLEGWVWKGIGLILTCLAASQGSSFWYDLLKRIRSVPAA